MDTSHSCAFTEKGFDFRRCYSYTLYTPRGYVKRR